MVVIEIFLDERSGVLALTYHHFPQQSRQSFVVNGENSLKFAEDFYDFQKVRTGPVKILHKIHYRTEFFFRINVELLNIIMDLQVTPATENWRNIKK